MTRARVKPALSQTCYNGRLLWMDGDNIPYILVYKLRIFGSILRFKLWGSAYRRITPHSQSRQSAWRLSVSAAHCVWATHGMDH